MKGVNVTHLDMMKKYILPYKYYKDLIISFINSLKKGDIINITHLTVTVCL